MAGFIFSSYGRKEYMSLFFFFSASFFYIFLLISQNDRFHLFFIRKKRVYVFHFFLYTIFFDFFSSNCIQQFRIENIQSKIDCVSSFCVSGIVSSSSSSLTFFSILATIEPILLRGLNSITAYEFCFPL